MTTRWLRFCLYSIIAASTLAVQSGPIKQAFKVLSARSYFAPEVACIPCVLAIFSATAGYMVWLAGGTLLGWRMPLFSHLLPIGLAVFSVSRGPLRPPTETRPMGPADRAVAAMTALKAELERRGAEGCRAEGASYEQFLREGRSAPGSGYRSYGRTVGYRVRVHPNRGDAVRELQAGDEPGTIHLACSSESYFLSAVIADGVPTGHPSMLRDGVGRVVVMLGDLKR